MKNYNHLIDLFQKKMRNNEIKNAYLFDEIKKQEEKFKRSDLKYKAKNTYMIFNSTEH